MTKQSIGLDETLYQYLLSVSFRDHPVLRELREETAQRPNAQMQISPEQGQFMSLLVKMLRATRILEIGTFTGYSALCMAMALPEDGRLVTCDVDETTTAAARRYWDKAGVADKIELKLAPAIETLQVMNGQTPLPVFDFMFIDALKTEYLDYFNLGLPLLRPGGVIAVDNVLWDGKVVNANTDDDDTRALREFNDSLFRDDRVEICMLALADGLTLALKTQD
jgi:predicted O-methyltransferase YrrM